MCEMEKLKVNQKNFMFLFTTTHHMICVTSSAKAKKFHRDPLTFQKKLSAYKLQSLTFLILAWTWFQSGINTDGAHIQFKLARWRKATY